MKNKYLILALFLLLAGAFFARFTHILWERDFWYDEAFTGILLKAPFGEMNQMIFADVHPPLYYWLAKPWAAMFGYSPLGIRSLSLVFGLATVLSGYWIGAKMFKNERAGILAGFFLAFSPFAIEYSQEARMYSLFGFLFLWSIWFFYQALEKDLKKDWILWGVFAGLSFYVHYLSLFFFVLFYAAFVAHQKLFKKSGWVRSFLGSRGFWMGVGVIFVFFASWLKIFFVHMMKGNLGWIGVSYLSDIPKTLQIFFFGHAPGTGGVPSPNAFKTVSVGKNVIHEVALFDHYSIGVLILCFLVGLAVHLWCKKKMKKEILVLSVMSLGTLLFLIVLSFLNIKLYVARYFMPAAVLIYLLFAGMFSVVFQKKASLFVLLLAYAGLLFLLSPVEFSRDWNDISHDRETYFNQDTVIVASNPFDYTTARFYFGKERTRFFNKANPEESFNWVLVKDESKLSSVQQLEDFSDVAVVDETCDWEGSRLVERGRVGRLAVCEVEK